MAIDFSGAATTRLDIGSAAAIDNISQGNILMWVFPLSATPAAHGGLFTKNAASGVLFQQRTTGVPRLQVAGTTSIIVLPNAAGTFGASKWCFVCAQWDRAGAASAQKLFHGDLTTLAAEYTYTTQQAGATFTDDSAASGIYGNDSGVANDFNGYIACARIVTGRLLSLAEIQAYQFNTKANVGAGVVDLRYLLDTSNISDLTGTNTATLTGGANQTHPSIPQRHLFGVHALHGTRH